MARDARRREAWLATDANGRELERLRAEVSELKAQLARMQAASARPAVAPGERAGAPPAKPARRRVGWRGPLATLLIVLGCVFAPVSVLAVWTANQVSNTSRYVANVSPLIRDPAVRGALTDKITTAISDKLDVEDLTKRGARELSSRGLTRLGQLLSGLAGSIASGVDSFIRGTVAKIVSSAQVTRLWIKGNTIAHTQLVRALSGQSSAITVSNGEVVIGLRPFIDQVKRNLAARGMTVVNKLPPINPTFPLGSAKYLVQARSVYRLLITLRWLLPLVALILLAAGIYVARRHRRALTGAGLGLAISMLALGAALAIGRAIYLSKIPPSVLPADAAAVVYDTLIRFIRQGLRLLLVLGLIVAIAGYFTGPSLTAVRTRSAFISGFGVVRGAGERIGLTTGGPGRWVYRHRLALRIAAVTVAAVVFVFWTNPTGLVVLEIALCLLVVLGLLELIGRPPGRTTRAGSEGRG